MIFDEANDVGRKYDFYYDISFSSYFKGILKYDWRNKNEGITPESTVLTILA